jgi:hypothetical protein
MLCPAGGSVGDRDEPHLRKGRADTVVCPYMRKLRPLAADHLRL